MKTSKLSLFVSTLMPADILTNPIQLSPGYLMYKAASKYNLPIPASSIKIGDVLTTVNGPSKVESSLLLMEL